MPVFETLERGFDLFGRHARGMLAVAAVVVVPTEAVVVALDPTGGWGETAWDRWLASVAVAIFGSTLAFVASTYALAAAETTGTVAVAEALLATLRRAPAALALELITIVGIGLATLALIVPGLIVLTRWFLAFQTFVFERRGPVKSLGRSWALTSGHGWPFFGLTLIVVAITGAGGLGSLLLRAFSLPDYAATFIGDTVAGVIVLPLTAAIAAAAYRGRQPADIPSWV